jgi:hypothetical protein
MANRRDIMAERLRIARKEAGYGSIADAAEAFESIKTPTLTSHENGTREFDAEAAIRYGKAFKVSPSWLLALDSVQHTPGGPSRVIESPEIPWLGKAAAGVWLEQSVRDPDSMETVPYDRMAGDPGPDNLFAITPEGDSMDLKWPEPVKLIFRWAKFGFADVAPGNYVLVERENHDLYEMTCKRLEIDEETGDFLLISESSNPKFRDPIRVPRSPEDGDHVDTGISILGKLVRAVQDY